MASGNGIIGRTIALLSILFVLVPLEPAAEPENAPPGVRSIRFGQHQEQTRIVLDLTRKLPVEVRALHEPPRLVIDLPEVRWRIEPHRLSKPRGLARASRYGKLEAGRSRLVVDISRPFRIVDELVLPPSGGSPYYRLVIDIAAADRREVPASAGQRTASLPISATDSKPAQRPPQYLPLPLSKPTGADGSAITTEALPRLRPGPPVVVLDPGHGGIDPGAVGINGLHEKHITLAMAKQLRGLLERDGRYEVVLTRETDTFLRLRDRIAKARRARADLFISIHADSLPQPSVRGASVYTLSETASDAEAARLAAKENKADIIAGTDLSHHDEVVAGILIDLAQRDTKNRSIELADTLVEELAETTKLVRNTRRYAGFVVLKSPDLPSVLLELGYLSNPTDAEKLADPGYRARLGRAIVEGIDRYFDDFQRSL